MFEAFLIFSFYALLATLTMIGFTIVQIRYGKIDDLDPNSRLVQLFRKASLPSKPTEKEPEVSTHLSNQDETLQSFALRFWTEAEASDPRKALDRSMIFCLHDALDLPLIKGRVNPAKYRWRSESFVDEVTKIVEKLSSSEMGNRHEYVVTPDEFLIRPCRQIQLPDLPKSFDIEEVEDVQDWKQKPN